jgi:hypothetical protein
MRFVKAGAIAGRAKVEIADNQQIGPGMSASIRRSQSTWYSIDDNSSSRFSIAATRRLDLGAVNGDVITDRHLR